MRRVTVCLALLALCGCANLRDKPGRSPEKSKPEKASGAQPSSYDNAIEVTELRERAVTLLARATESDSALIRANALEGLSLAGARVDPLLSGALHDENEGVRAVAAMVVGRLGLTRHAGEVRLLRTDPSPYVRVAALYAGAELGTDPDISPLASLLLRGPSYRIRAQAAYALGELGNSSAAQMVAEATQGSIPGGHEAEARLFHLQVAEALVKLGVEDQLEVLHAALYPSQAMELEATALAAQIVGTLEDKSATGDLINLVEYKDPRGNPMPAEVRLAAASALARLGQPKGTYIADEFAANENPALRAQAAALYGDIGLRENLGRLAVMLEDDSGAVRVSAASAILRSTQ